MNVVEVQAHIGIPRNLEGKPYQAIEQASVSQRQQRSFLADQCHLNPIETKD